MSLEQLAERTVIEFGKRARYTEIYTIMSENGVHDEDGSLARRVHELISDAIVRVKVRYA